MNPQDTPKTGPGMRLKALVLESHADAPSWDEAAAQIVGVPSFEGTGPAEALREALKVEFPMFNGADAQWDKVALGLLGKLESLGFKMEEQA